jgi:hypothetical protein
MDIRLIRTIDCDVLKREKRRTRREKEKNKKRRKEKEKVLNNILFSY